MKFQLMRAGRMPHNCMGRGNLDFWNKEAELGIEITFPRTDSIKEIAFSEILGKKFTISQIVGFLYLLCHHLNADFYEGEYPDPVLQAMKEEEQ